MRRLSGLLMVCLAGGVLTACQAPVDRALDRVDQTVATAQTRMDTSVALAKQGVDDSMAQAEMRVQRTLERAQDAALATVADIRAEYDAALQGTSEEVSQLREEFKADLDDLEAKLRERIQQVKDSALEVIAAGDKAAEERIDQVFRELRLFMQETLAEIRAMIEPVLTLATTLQGAVEKGNEHIAKVSEKLLELIDDIREIFKEVKDILHQVQGENEQGEKVETPWTEILVGLITGITALITTITLWLKRKADHVRDGERWKEEDLRNLITVEVARRVKGGEFDDELLGALTRLDLVKTKPNGGMTDPA